MTRVAAIQMTSCANVARNLAVAGELLRQARAQGAAVAVLPENFAFMGRGEADKLAVAETHGSGPIQAFLAEQARMHGLWIVGGTFPLKVPDEPRVAAACLVFDDAGREVARYDKIHLFDVDVPGKLESHRESKAVRPGTQVVTVDTPAGRLGLAICYDVRFPELFRELLQQGAEWFTLPSAFTVPTGRAHWELLLRARAVENLCYLVAPAQVGFHENGRKTHGDSMIVEPWGGILARLPRGTGVITAELDLARQRRLRQDFPCRPAPPARPYRAPTGNMKPNIPPPLFAPQPAALAAWRRCARSARRRPCRTARSGRTRREPHRGRARRRDGSRRRLHRHLFSAHARGVLGARGRHRQGRCPQHRAGRGRARAGR